MPHQKPRLPFPKFRLPKGGMISASDPELESSIEALENLAVLFAVIVICGVISTVIIAAIHPTYDSFLEQWGNAIADVFVAVGVAGEVWFARMAGLRQGELKRRSDANVGEANRIAAQANKEAAEARIRTAELEKLTAFRRLDPEMRRKLSEAFISCSSYLRLLIEYQAGDTEAYCFAVEFAQLFTKLGNEKIVFSSNMHLWVTSFGVHLNVGICDKSDELQEACLKGFDLPDRLTPVDLKLKYNPGFETNLYIFVGPKPPPKLQLSDFEDA